MHQIHHDLPVPFQAWLKKEYLYDLDSYHKGHYEPCTVFALSSYKDHRLTFKILLDNGSLFDYIPIDALVQKPNMLSEEFQFDLSELCFNKFCKDWSLTVSHHSIIETTKGIWCWFPGKNLWVQATEYICTIDWYTDNQNCHLVSLTNNQYAFVPNHKMMLTKEQPKNLPNYEPLRSTWK